MLGRRAIQAQATIRSVCVLCIIQKPAMRAFNAVVLLCCLTTLNAQWTWVPRASLGNVNQARWGTCEFVIGGKAYVVGGRVGSNDVNEVWAYDPQTDT